MFSTTGTLSNIPDDFLPLKEGGFLVTQMGSHTGGTPGRAIPSDRFRQPSSISARTRAHT